MKTAHYYQVLERLNGPRSTRQIRHLMESMYASLDFTNKTVIDIGGGNGLHALYCAARGAKSVTIIEPEGDGGNDKMIATFNKVKAEMNFGNVSLIRATIQELPTTYEASDVVLVQNAINHFDEIACINLRKSQSANSVYMKIFDDLARLTRQDGILLISDCSSSNLFPFFKMGNPIVKSIEWHKHQPPEVWEGLARGAGFSREHLRWSTPTRLGRAGQILCGNRFVAWFLFSHFTLTLRKNSD